MRIGTHLNMFFLWNLSFLTRSSSCLFIFYTSNFISSLNFLILHLSCIFMIFLVWFRFSIEWSKIEPQPGTSSHFQHSFHGRTQKEIEEGNIWYLLYGIQKLRDKFWGVYDNATVEHYHKVIDALIDAGIEPMITLHHFTEPLWFDSLGGFERMENIDLFVRFCTFVFREYHTKVKKWCTINEPSIYSMSILLFFFILTSNINIESKHISNLMWQCWWIMCFWIEGLDIIWGYFLQERKIWHWLFSYNEISSRHMFVFIIH